MVLLRVNREEFLHRLETVQPGMSKREILEQSSCFCFKNGEVFTFNDETFCRTSSGLPKDFEGAVPGEKLTAILRKLVEDDIDLDQEEGTFLIKGKGTRRVRIRMANEIALPIDKIESPTKWAKLPDEFCEAIGLVHLCASHDDSLFNMTCVHISPKWIEACDNVQLCRWRMETGITQSTIVRKTAIKHITTLGMTHFAETGNWLHFKNGARLILSCRRYFEEYPKLSPFIKFEGDTLTLPKGLMDETDRASIFSSEHTDNNLVVVHLEKGRTKIEGLGISGEYDSGWRKVDYHGPNITFSIAPQLLMDLVKRHNDCIINQERLKVDGGNYVYVATLHPPSGGEEKKPEEKENE